MAAVFRMAVDGWPRDRAIAEMRDAGFSSRYRSLARFVRDYEPVAASISATPPGDISATR